MKLLIVIIHDEDAEGVLKALTEKDFRVTHVASTGGFLRRGSSTLMIGTEAERVDEALGIVRATTNPPTMEGQRRATVFVLDMADFKQL